MLNTIKRYKVIKIVTLKTYVIYDIITGKRPANDMKLITNAI